MARAKGVSLAFMAVLSCCVLQGAGGVTIEFRNECQFPIWPYATQIHETAELNTGQSWTVSLTADSTGGRFWGRTGCVFGQPCATGDCERVVGGVLNCTPPATMVEYSLNEAGNVHFYDISVIGGFNIPISFIPSNSKCEAIACSSDITANCPAELKMPRMPGSCVSACTVYNTSQDCCTGDYGGHNCRPTNYSRFFKTQCPQAYTYPLDNATATFNCSTASNYTVLFCGAATSSPSAKTNGLLIGITTSGALIALAMMVVIAVYWKKFKTKQHLNEDYLTILHPNPTKSRAFELREIMESTQNFNQKIGQGGFGSVFFGKLEGRDIAVKVLSVFSTEGLHQFQNEVDLLSKIHHKNLVSLLGFCNESKEVILIYEYMSEGSLRDHLYGWSRRAFPSKLESKAQNSFRCSARTGIPTSGLHSKDSSQGY